MRKKLFIILIMILIASSVFVLARYLKQNKDKDLVIVDETMQDFSKEEKEGVFIAVIFGIDGDRGLELIKRKNQELKDKTGSDKYYTTGNPSDTIMLTRFDLKTKDINIVSIPRDTKTEIAGRKGLHKINASFAKDGPFAAVDSVRDFSKVNFDKYVAVDYNAVREIVDILGGIEIDVPFDMKYDDPTDDPPLHIDLKKGLQLLNGTKAMQYLRWRKFNDKEGYKNGDLGRVNTQQNFVHELIKQTFKKENVAKLPRIIKAVFSHIETNISFDEILSLIPSMLKISPQKVHIDTIPGKEDYEKGWYFIPDREKSQELFKKIFK